VLSFKVSVGRRVQVVKARAPLLVQNGVTTEHTTNRAMRAEQATPRLLTSLHVQILA